MTISNLCEQAYAASKAKGFHDSPLLPLEAYMLICSEVAEAAESLRAGEPAFWLKETDIGFKPEGQASELADAVIRIADYCGSQGWDLQQIIEQKMAYNSKRPHKHGKLK